MCKQDEEGIDFSESFLVDPDNGHSFSPVGAESNATRAETFPEAERLSLSRITVD